MEHKTSEKALRTTSKNIYEKMLILSSQIESDGSEYMSQIEKRLKALERFKDHYQPMLDQIVQELELRRPRINPIKYCSDELDQRILNYLIEQKGAGTSEIAKALGLNPEKGRHTIGKRLEKIRHISEDDAWDILEFHPEVKEGKFRAWWLRTEKIDVEAFRNVAKT